MGAIVHSSSGAAPPLINIAGPLLMLAFAGVIVGIGRFAARNEKSEILKVLATTLGAREVSEPGAG